MTSIRLIVEGTSARAEVTGELIAGMVGIPVTIECDSTWNGLSRDLVCRSGEGSGELSACTRMIPNVANTATVAHEVMVGGRPLYLGLEGYNGDGTVVYPTKWADCGMILDGADASADPAMDPAIPAWRRVQTILDQVPEAIRAALVQAKESGEFNGRDGVDGKDGTNGRDGVDGKDGINGRDGVDGKDGTNGRDGVDGKDGTNGRDGVDGKDGTNGRDGVDGKDGTNGRDGYTPVKYVDYWTEVDQEEIVQQAVSLIKLQFPIVGRVGDNMDIILNGALACGTYTLKYEDAEGNVTEIGTLVHDPDAPDYTNWIPLATDVNGNVLNGTGYQVQARLSTSSGTTSSVTNPNAVNAVFATGFIPVKKGDVIRLENCWMDTVSLDDSSSPYGHRTWALFIAFYDGLNNTMKRNEAWTTLANSTAVTPVVDSDGKVRQFTVNVSNPYMRLNLGSADPSGAILTINEPIE